MIRITKFISGDGLTSYEPVGQNYPLMRNIRHVLPLKSTLGQQIPRSDAMVVLNYREYELYESNWDTERGVFVDTYREILK